MTTQTHVPEVLPEGFGSIPEFLVFTELQRQGLQHGPDFIYQSRFFGVAVLGAIEADFLFTNPPRLAINVQGDFFHYQQGVVQKGKDLMARAQLAGLGITMIFIDDTDILQSPGRLAFVVREALQYRDHSRLTRGF